MTNVDGKNVNDTQSKKIKTLLISEHTTTTDGKDLKNDLLGNVGR